MKMTIHTGWEAFGAEATVRDAERGAEYLRRVARLLGLRLSERWHEGTDDAQEIWGDGDGEPELGYIAYAAWCRRLTVERGACLCAPDRVPGPIIRDACRDAKPMRDGLDAERRLLAAVDALEAAGLDSYEAGRALDTYFRVSPGDRRGSDVRHRCGRWCLVTNNGVDRIVRA